MPKRAALCFVFWLAVSGAFTVAAPVGTQLAQVALAESPGHRTHVTLTFTGAVSGGWKLIGSGSTDVAVMLPNTTLASPGPLPSRSTGSVQSFDYTQNGSELFVTFHVARPVMASASASGTTLSILLVEAAPQRTMAAAPARNKTAEIAAPSFVVIPLKYADVSEVAGVLIQGQQVAPNDSFQAQGSIFSLPTTTNGTQPLGNQQTYTSQGASAPQSLGEKLTDDIAIDRRLNAIILSGTPQRIAALKAMVNAIDVPLPSVMLECQVVELSETAARDLGLEFASGQGSSAIGGQAVVQSGSGPQFRASLEANLFATIAHGGGRILATPRVLAQSGMPAQILTGDALPIIQTTIFPGSPTVTQVTTNYIAVGVNLQIQPRITNDGFVTSHVFAEVSSVTAYTPTTQGNVPQISLREATTSATVANGTPFIIGGLLRDEEISNMSKIPLLGDLPIVGGFFRARHDSSTRSNLFVIITPYIVGTAQSNQAIPSALPTPNVPMRTPQN